MNISNHHPANRRRSKTLSHGLTLIELVVVLTILVALAGLVLPRLVNFAERDVAPTAVNSTLVEIRGAVMRYWNDCKFLISSEEATDPDFAIRIDDLLVNPFDDLTTANVEEGAFDRQSGVGWRGPYIVSSSLIPVNSGSSQSNDIPDAMLADTNLNGYFRVNTAASAAVIPAITDPWGTPIVIQDIAAFRHSLMGEAIPTLGNIRRIRIVSAGAGPYNVNDNTTRRNLRSIDHNPTAQVVSDSDTDDHSLEFDLR